MTKDPQARPKAYTREELKALAENLPDMVSRHTGTTEGDVDADTVSDVIRNESVIQRGLGHVLDSRVIGHDPLKLTDKDVEYRIDEYKGRFQVGAYLDKPPEEVTPEDFRKAEELRREVLADGLYGKPFDKLSPIEQAKLNSDIRNAEFDARVKAEEARQAEAARKAEDSARSGAGTSADAGNNTDMADAAGAAGAGGGFGTGSGPDLIGMPGQNQVPDAPRSPATDAATQGAGTTGGHQSDDSAQGAGIDGSSLAGVGAGIGPGLGDAAFDHGQGSSDQPAASDQPRGSTGAAPSTPAPSDDIPTDYGSGQSMPAYDEHGFVGSVAGPEDLDHDQTTTVVGNAQESDGIWMLVIGGPDGLFGRNLKTGEEALWDSSIEGWVNTSTGEVVGTSPSLGSGSNSTDEATTGSDTATNGESNSTNDDSQSNSDEGGDDDGDDDDDGSETADTTEATSSDEDGSESDDSGSAGEEGTPVPDRDYGPRGGGWIGHRETRVGRTEHEKESKAVDDNRPGAGLGDPVQEDRGSSGGPMRFIGGYSDPPDWAEQGSGFSPIDPSRLPGAGVTDPPPDEDGPTSGGGGPIVGGGLSIADPIFDSAGLGQIDLAADRSLFEPDDDDDLDIRFDTDTFGDFFDH